MICIMRRITLTILLLLITESVNTYIPKFKVGDCIYESISTAIVYINKIKNNRYYYTVNQSTIVFQESKDVEKFDKQDNIQRCNK